MTAIRYLGAAAAAAAMFVALLIGYEFAVQALVGPHFLDTHALANVSRFVAAALGALGGAAAVLVRPRKRR